MELTTKVSASHENSYKKNFKQTKLSAFYGKVDGKGTNTTQNEETNGIGNASHVIRFKL